VGDPQIRTAMEYASQRWRAIVRGGFKPKGIGLRKRKTAPLGFRPANWDALVKQLAKQERIKPTSVGDRVIWAPHDPSPLPKWNVGEVVHLGPHRDTMWVVVRKPGTDSRNPFLAIDSTNVFLCPKRMEPTVYVLSNEDESVFYIGQSQDTEHRLSQHAKGRGSRVTKNFGIVKRHDVITKRRPRESLTAWEKRELDAQTRLRTHACVRGAGLSRSK